MFLWGLTIAKFLRSEVRHLETERSQPVLYIIMRDGTWAFALIFCESLLRLFWTPGPFEKVLTCGTHE